MAATGGDGCGESPRSLQVPGPTAARPRSLASADRRTPAGSVAGSAVDPAATVGVRGDADIDGSDDDLDDQLDPVEAAGVGGPQRPGDKVPTSAARDADQQLSELGLFRLPA